jgi:hypothetical protein
MRKISGVLLLLAVATPVLGNWTCPACGRDNWDKDKVCRWCRGEGK